MVLENVTFYVRMHLSFYTWYLYIYVFLQLLFVASLVTKPICSKCDEIYAELENWLQSFECLNRLNRWHESCAEYRRAGSHECIDAFAEFYKWNHLYIN